MVLVLLNSLTLKHLLQGQFDNWNMPMEVYLYTVTVINIYFLQTSFDNFECVFDIIDVVMVMVMVMVMVQALVVPTCTHNKYRYDALSVSTG